ncbi:MAG: SH3 domain-containing protein [Desulfatibacillum sp.]|nr:SH3 domain-containing protein [Desulfatibacillum sp.]
MGNSTSVRLASCLILIFLGASLSACAMPGAGSNNPEQFFNEVVEAAPCPDDILKIKKEYKGYCKAYKPVKDLIYAGNFDQAIQVYHTPGPDKSGEQPCDGVANEGKSAPPQRQGISQVSLNVRTAPNGEKISMLPNGGAVSIIEDRDGWYHVKGNDINGKPIDGWASAKYIAENATAAGNTPSTANGMPIVNLNSKPMKVLHNMELGVLNLETGDSTACYDHIQTCLDELGMEGRKGRITAMLQDTLLKTAGMVLGNPGLKPYDPVGYEKVMLLNYKSLNYLLEGERKAFNVARLSIDWQNMEREALEKELEKIKEKQNKENSQSKETNPTGENTDSLPDIGENSEIMKTISGADGQAAHKGEANPTTQETASLADITRSIGQLKALFGDEYSDTHEIAMRADSAYVNPFADYMNGLIMEFEAYNDPNKIDDAKNAYAKACQLNPTSNMLKNAAKDMEQAFEIGNMDGRGKVLHVVVCDGFAPEIKVVSTVVPIPPNKLITVQLPKREPLVSDVKTVKLLTSDNKILATLDVIADMDAMVLRYQKDAEPGMFLMAGAMVLRSFAGQTAAENWLGDFGAIIASTVLDGTSSPETRSWTSLPSTIRAARVHLPKGLKSLKIASYDKKGRLLASQKVTVAPDANNFVYARSIGKQLKVQAAENIWVN